MTHTTPRALGLLCALTPLVTCGGETPRLDPPTITWSIDLEGAANIRPALAADGTLYLGTSEGRLSALSPGDGAIRWSHAFTVAFDPEPLVDGIPESLVGALPPELALDQIPDSIWFDISTLDFDDLSNSSPVLSPDGAVVYSCGTTSGVIRAFDAITGEERWTLDVHASGEAQGDPLHFGGGFVSTPAIGEDGTLYVGSGNWWGDQWFEAETELGIDIDAVQDRKFSDRRLYAITPDGAIKWSFAVEATDTRRTSLFASPAIASDGTIYVGSFNGIFYALRDDGDAPTELWRHAVQGGELTDYHEWWSSPAIGAEGQVYVGSNDGSLYAFTNDGALAWRHETGLEIFASPVIGEDGAVFVPSEDFHVHAVEPDGTPRWRQQPWSSDELPATVTALADGTVLVGLNHSRSVYALDQADGGVAWSVELPEGGDELGTAAPVAVGDDGTIYQIAGGTLFAIAGYAPLADSPWPAMHKDPGNRGR